VHRKDHDVTLMLLSGSITGTLFTIHEARSNWCELPQAFHLASPTTRSLLLFIDSSEVKQYVTALCLAMRRMLPKL
jgi:hypothetical protein